MKSFIFISSFISVVMCIGVSFANVTNGQINSLTKYEEAKVHIDILRKNVEQVQEDFKYVEQSLPEVEEIEGQIYTLLKRINTLRPKDEFEWVESRTTLEASYQDLLRNLHIFRSTNHRQR